jgi:CubicO group peptidase (beta-lactamase class C family)
MPAMDQAQRVLEGAIERRVFPAASVEVGASFGPLWRSAVGRLTFDEASAPTSNQTVFDLASLTKVIATTTVIMDLVSRGLVDLTDALASFFLEWRGVDRDQVTVRDLLEHASGLAARLVDAPPSGRREFEHDICTMPLEYSPRTQSIYSDLGFILLGFLAADRGRVPFAVQFEAICDRLSTVSPDIVREALTFEPDAALRKAGTAPTMPMDEDARRGRMLVGEVHDNYAWALGGTAGHAGLFGSSGSVGAFGRAVLRAARGDEAVPAPLSPKLVARVLTKTSVPGSSRALGWDTMLPTSSCGSRMSRDAVGHVGFTGTSLWIDPSRDRYFVLLTNRACGGGSLDEMREVRRAFHDALGDL